LEAEEMNVFGELFPLGCKEELFVEHGRGGF
jgi:hypothetical protein